MGTIRELICEGVNREDSRIADVVVLMSGVTAALVSLSIVFIWGLISY